MGIKEIPEVKKQELIEKYGDFWEFSGEAAEFMYGKHENVVVNEVETRRSLETELVYINDHLTSNTRMHVYLLQRFEKLLRLLERDDEAYETKIENTKLDEPKFQCDTGRESYYFWMEMNHLLPKMKKTFQLKEYQELRDFYIPRIIASLREVRPSSPLNKTLIVIKQNIENQRLFDIDNRFRSFVLDALVGAKIIKNDDIDNVIILEKSIRKKNAPSTEVYVVPEKFAPRFINDYQLLNC
ncbi:hypothetical protein D7Z54_29855 [Salibacterium salarium]|uniref:Uncharacterized protein n=1 Tax=Salibacterium salarium TaxID=284579 RepID=A0A428MU80_9BACI|nr:hypothetical protein [Salibacterium salarium]RSL29689.1 hypothetical protein D7Z54_29855 [Salibacterium salarium]